MAWTQTWRISGAALFWLLSSFVVIGELLPIPVPRRHGLAKVTISSAFAFAILIRFGVLPAAVVYAGSCLVADGIERVAPIKALFNVAQYTLAVVSAGAVLLLAGELPMTRITAEELPAVLAAAAAFFVVNHLLACTAAALLAGIPIMKYMRDDLAFQAWTAGCVLAFAPAVVASANSSLALVPVAFVPLLAIYAGGRKAAAASHLAYHDALTELPNRRLLSERLRVLLAAAEREGQPIGVLLLDLDDFKSINDTLGHELGDLAIKQVAQRFEASLGEHAMLARLGGDEFAAVVAGGQAEAEATAEKLLGALDRPLELESLQVHTGASIGISYFPQHGRNVRELLRHADIALYCAKASNAAFQAYTEEYDEYSIDRLALAAQLRRGIERGELTVEYQPKVPLGGGPVSSVEALVRWNHPQLGRIEPSAFIPLAEQTGIIKPLTERVLESALAQVKQWRAEGLDISVSINVSTRSLLDHELPSMIGGALERWELPASVLQLEITESRVIADLRRARAALDQLRAMKVTIAIDDFGTGFSSLSQLQQLPIDELKIDRSFVTRMESKQNDAVLVRSMIELGQNLGLRVTAEGVETENVTSKLRQLGCDFAQGFHTGRPMPADEFRRHLEATEPSAPALVTAIRSVR
jgi:diguanylate cyclase (GGDEF)-like protein